MCSGLWFTFIDTKIHNYRQWKKCWKTTSTWYKSRDRVFINIILVTFKTSDLIKDLSEYVHVRICRIKMPWNSFNYTFCEEITVWIECCFHILLYNALMERFPYLNYKTLRPIQPKKSYCHKTLHAISSWHI